MSTMEHLFMQIFDRKQYIDGQLKHQAESYSESLAYNVLAEGKQPPPWLWTTGLGVFRYLDPKDKASVCLSGEMMANGSAMGGIEEVFVARTQSTKQKVPCSLKGFTSLSENLDSYIANDSLSCSGENPVLLEKDKIETSIYPEDAIGKSVNHNWIAHNSAESQGTLERATFPLRSLGSNDVKSDFSRSSMSDHAGSLKQGKETFRCVYEMSWPKRRIMERRSIDINATSPRLRFEHSQSNKQDNDWICMVESPFRLEIQPLCNPASIRSRIPNNTSEAPSESVQQSKRHSITKGCSYSEENSQSVLTTLPNDHTQEELNCDMTDRNLEGCLKDCHDSLDGISKVLYNSKAFIKDKELCVSRMNSHMQDASSSPCNDSGLVCFDETMPEFESCSIAFPSSMEENSISNDSNLSSLAKERESMLERLCKSDVLAHLLPNEHRREELLCDTTDRNLPCCLEDCLDSLHGISSSLYNSKLSAKDKDLFVSEVGPRMHDASSSPCDDSGLVCFDKTMPEFEGCSTALASSSMEENSISNDSKLSSLAKEHDSMPERQRKSDVLTPALPNECRQEELLCDTADRNLQSCFEDCLDSLHGISRSLYDSKISTKDTELCVSGMGSHMHDASSSSCDDSGMVCFDETTPEFEGCSIVIPSSMEESSISIDSKLSSLAKERDFMLEQLCKSDVLAPVVPNEHTQAQLLCDTTDRNLQSCLEDCRDSLHGISKGIYNSQVSAKDNELFVSGMSSHMHDASSSPCNSSGLVCFNGTMTDVEVCSSEFPSSMEENSISNDSKLSSLSKEQGFLLERLSKSGVGTPALPNEHAREQILCDTTDINLHSCLKNCYGSLDGISEKNYMSTKDKELGLSSRIHDASSSPCDGSGLVFFGETMSEFEGCSIVFPSSMEENSISNDSEISSLAKERDSMLERLCKSDVLTPAVPNEHTKKELLCDATDINLQSYVKNCTDSLRGISSSLDNSKEFIQAKELFVSRLCSHMQDASGSPCDSSDLVCLDATMPEFEGFSIVCPSSMEENSISNDSKLSSLAKERESKLEQLCKSDVLTPISCASKYKIHKVPDAYQSLPTGLLESIRLSYTVPSNDADMEAFRRNDEGNMRLQFDSSFVERPYSYSMPYSSIRIDGEATKPPLTPPVMKFGQKAVSARSGASSEKVGSNPELICFRIDEDSSIADENEQVNKVDAYKKDIPLRESKGVTNREPLVDITAISQMESTLMTKSTTFLDRGSLEPINSKSHFSSKVTHSTRKDRDNTGLIVDENLGRKGALSLRNRSTKPQISGKVNERSRSHGNLERACKPTNLVSNLSSFVPLVRQKQQTDVPSKGRKDIKVKALLAAELTKQLEQKRQNVRETRKAAAKLELEKRLELKRKQEEEERKKNEADITRKRQREGERKGKERKRRCIEETQRQKMEQDKRPRAGKEDKKGENEPRQEELVKEANGQLQLDKCEVVLQQTPEEMQQNITKVLAIDERNSNIVEDPDSSQNSKDVVKVLRESNVLEGVLQKRITIPKENQDIQSYEMSPYIDSDDEEDRQEEIRRENKHIPLWARRKRLNEILLSNQHIDPAKVFSRKCSFILNEVLSTRTHGPPF